MPAGVAFLAAASDGHAQRREAAFEAAAHESMPGPRQLRAQGDDKKDDKKEAKMDGGKQKEALSSDGSEEALIRDGSKGESNATEGFSGNDGYGGGNGKNYEGHG